MNDNENTTMQHQQRLDFDAPAASVPERRLQPEPEHVATDTSLPPPLVRPDRQIVYPDATTHYDWPPATELHDRDTITVDRISEDIDGPAHRFVVKRGDTVEAYMGHNRFHTGQVIGISHARGEVRVAWDDTLARGGWFKVGAIYPAPEPEPTTASNGTPLAAIVEQLNAENAPPGGWSDRDRVPAPYEFAEFKELWTNGLRHKSYAEYRSQFERLSRSHDELVAELQSSYKAPKLKAIAANLGDWHARQNTKQQNAESIYRKMLASFLLDGVVSVAMGESYVEAVKTKVLAVTEDQWLAHYAELEAKQTERREAIENPRDLRDFRLFIEARGEAALTNEQMARWDSLHADLSRERRAENGASAVVTRFESEEARDVEFTIKQGFHDKRRCPLWIVQIGARVERETYRELLAKAKQLGGWYSSFKKADAGFQFLSEETAERFTGLLSNDADRSDVLAGRKERKEQTAAERLHELADQMLERADETIARSEASRQNTARRADIQAGVRGRAHAEAALARSLHSVATAISTGEATYLDGIRHRTHLEELDRVLMLARWGRLRAIRTATPESDYGYGLNPREEEKRPVSEDDIRYAAYPYPSFSARHLADLVRECRNKRGLKLLSARLTKRLPRSSEGNDFITVRHEHSIELVADFASRAKAAGVDCSRVIDQLAPYQRLQRACLGDIHELRAALREYLPHRAAVRGDDPVRIAERELIGKKLPGFFPTPPAVIEQMLELAAIEPGETVLEPSCGKGDIVLAVKQAHPQSPVTAIELNRTLADVLAAKDLAVEFADFLSHEGCYDRIVMNPPFENLADIDHVRHAYECLAAGGRLVSVMSESPFFRQDRKATDFQRWFASLDGHSIKLPEDAFKGADAFRQTGVRTRLVILLKDG
ncbi:MAG: hypothetical protein CMJ58_12445 [Planctomycetaceae bacterium]|nr:hypothetical protein [Planctomycetaceae bacterium]